MLLFVLSMGALFGYGAKDSGQKELGDYEFTYVSLLIR